MKIVAITREGAEFVYKASTAHKVSKAGAERICSLLNKARWDLKHPDEKWFVYEVGRYDIAYDIAERQKFYFAGKALRRMA